MSVRPDLRPEDAPDRAPEELVPEDIEDLYEDVGDLPTDAPEPQGFLPPPEAPKGGPSIIEERVRTKGFVLLDTEEEVERAEALLAAPPEERHEQTEDALQDWRARADGRRAAWHRAELEAARRRTQVVRGLTLGLILGLFAAWGLTEFVLSRPDQALAADAPGEPETAPEAALQALEQAGAGAAGLAPEVPSETLAGLVTSPLAEEPSDGFDAKLMDGRFKSWVLDDHHWWQFDFEGSEPLHLRWIAPDGNVKLEGWTCDNRITTAIGRCYVGQHLAHFAPEPGQWSLYACADEQASACEMVHEFTIAEGLQVSWPE